MRARLIDKTVVGILNGVAGFPVEQCYHPDIIAQSVAINIPVEQGWTIEDDGTIKDAEGVVQYTPPVVEEPVVEETPPAE